MLGMEMMFSNLIGMTPAQIKESAEQTMKLIQSAAENMKRIDERLERIEAILSEKGIVLNGHARGRECDGNDSEYVQL